MPLNGVTIPGPITAFRGNYVSMPAAMLKPPVEGNRTIPIGIEWATDGMAPGYTVEFNAEARQVRPITQIPALYVDNTGNASNVVIVFPDTNFSLVVQANSSGYFPVVSNSVRFLAFCELQPTAQDRTFIEVLNFLPPTLILEAPTSGAGGGGGVGTVTEVDTVAPLNGGPITTQGTLGMDIPLAVQWGGTGSTSAAGALTSLGAAPLNSPTFTGTPRAPRASVSSPNPLDLVNVQWITDWSPFLLTNPSLIGGVIVGSPIGGRMPAGSLNAESLYVGAVPAVPDPGALTITQYGQGAWIYAIRANGTAAAPSPVLLNEALGGIAASGYATGGFTAYSTAGLSINATENWTATAQGSAVALTGLANGTIPSPIIPPSMVVQAGVTIGAVVDEGFGTLNVQNGIYLAGAPHSLPLGAKLTGEQKAAFSTLGEDEEAAIPRELGQTGLTLLCITDQDGLEMQDVTLGEPDSGGAGYRCLRVPN